MTTPILSIDGGGLFGIIPLSVLRHIEDTTGRPIASLFRLISGVSSGGLIVLGLSIPSGQEKKPLYNADEILTFYRTQSQQVFCKTKAGNWCGIWKVLATLHHFFFSKYSSSGMTACLEAFFSETRLSQALCPVVVPAYNISHSGRKEPRLKLFRSYKTSASGMSFKGDYLMKDVAYATSAAPTYFPPKILPRRTIQGQQRSFPPYHLIDGALAAYDPSLIAYAQAQDLFGQDSPLLMVSLGTSCTSAPYYKIMRHPSPGILSWRHCLSRLLLDPGRSAHQSVLKTLLRQDPRMRCLRFMPDLMSSAFDDHSPQHISYLENHAHAKITGDWALSLAELTAFLKDV